MLAASTFNFNSIYAIHAAKGGRRIIRISPANAGSRTTQQKQEVGEVLTEFLENTSVPGLSQLAGRRNIVWKCSWIFMTLIGFSMAVYQSRNVITDYYEESVVQRISYSSPSVLPLPSVTVCSNIFIDEQRLRSLISANEKFLPFLEMTVDDIGEEPFPKAKESYRSLIQMMFKERWNETQRLHLCGSIDRRLHFMAVRPDKKYSFISLYRALNKGILHEFHNFAFGCCFTVNPGFENKSAVLNGRGTELIIELNMDLSNRMIKSNDFFATLLVHSLGTPPLLGSPDLIEVYPGDYIKINLKPTKLMRAAELHKCVSDKDPTWRQTMALYTDNTPYIYERNACEETCQQNSLRDDPQYECVQPQLPVTDDILTQQFLPSLCLQLFAVDILTNSNISCNCPTACEEYYVKKSVISTSGVSWIANKNMVRLNRTGIAAANQTFLRARYETSVIRLMYEAGQMEIITEENKYSVADFWGIIGGNLGLWVGLCLLSCIEVIEFLYSISSTFLRRFGNCKEKL